MIMVTWNDFIWFGTASVLLSVAGSAAAWFESGSRARRARLAAEELYTAALIAIMVFIIGLWDSLGRPPLRTMGETTLW